jgi:hypothetical protein
MTNFFDKAGNQIDTIKNRPMFHIDDKQGMVDGFCRTPWQELIITPDGNIWNCGCPGKVKIPIGNLLKIKSSDDFMSMFENNSFKDSILDGSYRNCIALRCPILENNMLKVSTSGFEHDISELKKPIKKTIYLDLDISCNLKCPTCRSEVIINKNNQKYIFTKKLMDQFEKVVMPSFDSNFIIRTSGGGEIFASHAMLPWLLNFDFNKYPNIKFLLHTNATLLYKHEEFLTNLANNIVGFHISIDAASEETYKKTRINGKWDDMINGLEIANKLRKINPGIHISHSFCISSSNYHEINKFVTFSKSFSSDSIIIQTLDYWGQSATTWKEINIFDTAHPEHNNFIEEIKNFNLDEKNIYHSLYFLKNSI